MGIENIVNITHNKERLALIVKGHKPEGKYFVSSEEDCLQVGYMNLKEKEKINRHFHKDLVREIKKTQEVLYILSGRVKIDFYFDKRKVEETILEAGDLVILLNGGHSFEFLEETDLIEIKQGPYLGADIDKERF
jgi:mannose-6-phosphate isomerase-like protein (cupin superfamily)